MARDPGLEELVREDLGDRPGLSEKPMFGGLAWLLDGHLLCGARDVGLMVRLGKGNDGWALELPDVEPMVMSGRQMNGWVRAGLDTCADDDLRRRLLEAAVAFVRTLPPKF
ncbi:MAG TPA: TfoX/Sxy family protein [Devosia sp.]|nr:TfoX/Sxy family protein [Devosia sp.]